MMKPSYLVIFIAIHFLPVQECLGQHSVLRVVSEFAELIGIDPGSPGLGDISSIVDSIFNRIEGQFLGAPDSEKAFFVATGILFDDYVGLIEDIVDQLRPDEEDGTVQPGSVLEKINALTSQVNPIANSLNTLGNSITDDITDAITDAVASLSADIESIESKVESIECNSPSANQCNVDSLNGNVNSIREAVASLSANIGSIESKLDTLTAKVESPSANAEPSVGNSNTLEIISGEVDGSKHLLLRTLSQVNGLEAKMDRNMKKMHRILADNTKLQKENSRLQRKLLKVVAGAPPAKSFRSRRGRKRFHW